MNIPNVYSILKSKPNKYKKLLKYYRKILIFSKVNGSLDAGTYTENHHICPRELFPEYKNLKTYKWNSIRLTTYQHIIAHILLSDAYGGGQIIAANLLMSCGRHKNNKDRKLGEINSISIGRISQIRNELSKLKQNTKDYNNGIIQVKRKTHPGNGWHVGKLPQNYISNKLAVSKAVCGSTTYTDGITNIRIQPTGDIPSGFVLGMKYKDNITYSYTNDERSIIVSFIGNHIPPSGLKRVYPYELNTIMKRVMVADLEVNTIDDAKILMSHCSRIVGKIDPTMSWLYSKHIDKFRELFSVQTHISDKTVLVCALLGVPPKLCACCSKQTNVFEKQVFKEYCSYSCASKIRVKTIKRSNGLLCK